MGKLIAVGVVGVLIGLFVGVFVMCMCILGDDDYDNWNGGE